MTKQIIWLVLLMVFSVALQAGPLQQKIAFEGKWYPANARFLRDITWFEEGGQHSDQQIFDALFKSIGEANHFILIDMFLYNSLMGNGLQNTRPLAEQLTRALLDRKQKNPEMRIVVISDPINTVYGSRESPYFARLQQAGISVVLTDLEKLNDSNTVYSKFWRIFIKPFGEGKDGGLFPNPFGEGRVSLRTYLRLLNFKANHRKLMVADSPGGTVGFVLSANPHDGSSSHHNVGVRFDGPAVWDLLKAEIPVLEFSGYPDEQMAALKRQQAKLQNSSSTRGSAGLQLKVVTENRIKREVLDWLDKAGEGDRVELLMFYLSDREIIKALKESHHRGADVRVILDPNKDAFGLEKSGVPNRPVADELDKAGIPVRWCNTHGEQCHSKVLTVSYRTGETRLILGSANFTRRNLDNFNLETDVAMKGEATLPVLLGARDYFELLWNNSEGYSLTVDYDSFKDDSRLRKWQYRFMEASGLSTF